MSRLLCCIKCGDSNDSTYFCCNLHGGFGGYLCQVCREEHLKICKSLPQIDMNSWWKVGEIK